MAYYDVALMTMDPDLRLRVKACVVLESIPSAESWVANHPWELAKQPGWDAAWASARAAGKESIGADEGVISDDMILSAVQYIYAAENVQAEEPGMTEEGGAS